MSEHRHDESPSNGDLWLRVVRRDEQTDGIVVERADDRVSMSPDVWGDLLNRRGEGRVEISQDGSRIRFGIDGMGLGRVVYRVVKVTPSWVHLERERHAEHHDNLTTA